MLGPLFLEQGKDIGDRPCSDQPTTAVITTKDMVDALIWDDFCIMRSELCTTTGIGKLAVAAIIRELG
jgi:hypothetical protein